MLEVRDVRVRYGAGEALRGVSFRVEAGEIVAVLGANGAGKSTILRAVSALVPVAAGRIAFQGRDLTLVPAEKIVRLGVTHCPEGRRIFPECSARENLEMGGYTLRSRAALRDNLERVFHYFPRLRERSRQAAATLSGGEQQMLGVGRALMSSPRLLLLDEPSLGLAPVLVNQIFEIIRRINRDGVTILLVEQNAFEALQISQRGYILEAGSVILSGASAELLKDPRVAEAYLGLARDPRCSR